MTERDMTLSMWISVIKAEYQEMPGLQLTKPQVCRLWGLGESDCEHVLDTLQATEFLRVTARGRYALADRERTHAPSSVQNG
jgi:hypothetical protein